MIISTSETKALRLAQMCAAKSDVRYFLNGFCIDFPNATAIGAEDKLRMYRIPTVGTNGHILTVAKIVWEVTGELPIEPVIVQATPVAATSKKASIVLPNEGPPRLSSFSARGKETLAACVRIDGTYPDYNRIVNTYSSASINSEGIYAIALDAHYLSLLSKALGGSRAILRFDMTSADALIRITPGESIGDVEIYLMPVRGGE